MLEATTPFGGYDRSFADAHLSEVTDLALVSLALPLGGEAPVAAAVEAAWGTAPPAPGRSVLSADGSVRLIGMGADQIMVALTHAAPDARAHVDGLLGGAGYTTDQSDVWSALMLSGPGARRALERLSPVDLHPAAFAVDDAARTVMEHLGVLIIRTDEDAYLLLSARSSAGSFLHAVEQSVRNTA